MTRKTPAPPRVLSMPEAAALLGIKPDTLRQQAQNGILTATKVGQTWVTTEAAVEQYRADRLGRRGRRPKAGKPARPALDTGAASTV